MICDCQKNSNLIKARFDRHFKGVVRDFFIENGYDATVKQLLSEGFHESFAKAIIKNALKHLGWGN